MRQMTSTWSILMSLSLVLLVISYNMAAAAAAKYDNENLDRKL